MARARASGSSTSPGVLRAGTVRLGQECLKLDLVAPRDILRLRSWIRQVNGSAFAQPYLVEAAPGRFRLYVGEAAERLRTRQGILPRS